MLKTCYLWCQPLNECQNCKKKCFLFISFSFWFFSFKVHVHESIQLFIIRFNVPHKKMKKISQDFCFVYIFCSFLFHLKASLLFLRYEIWYPWYLKWFLLLCFFCRFTFFTTINIKRCLEVSLFLFSLVLKFIEFIFILVSFFSYTERLMVGSRRVHSVIYGKKPLPLFYFCFQLFS